MSDSAHQNPILGPGFSTGVKGWGFAFLIVVIAGVIGLAFTFTDPRKMTAVFLLLFFVVFFTWASMRYPLASLSMIILAQVLIPVYVRLPIPGVPSVPPALLLLLGIVAISGAIRMIKPIPWKPSSYEKMLSIAVLVYGVVLLVSIPNTHASTSSLAMFVKTVMVPLLLFFTVISKVKTVEQMNTIFHVLLVAAVLCGLVAMHEFYTYDNIITKFYAPDVTAEEDFFLWYLTQERKNELLPTETIYRVFSFFTQPLEYSAFMIMTFPIAALNLVTAKTNLAKALYGLSALVIFVGFAVSFSRGPTLALALVILVLAFYEKRVRPWIMVGSASIIITLIAVWPILAEKLTTRLTGSRNVTLRFRLWENGIQTFLENPLRGIGYGSYPKYHIDSIREHRIGPMYEYPWQHIERVTTMENIFITLAAETGVIGLTAMALYLAVYFYLFRKVMAHANDDKTRLVALCSMAGVLGFLLSGMTVANIVGYTISTLYFGVFIAAMAVLARSIPVRRPAPDPNR